MKGRVGYAGSIASNNLRHASRLRNNFQEFFFRIVPWWLVRCRFLGRLQREHMLIKNRYALHAALESRQRYVLGSWNVMVIMSKNACRTKVLKIVTRYVNDCKPTSWNSDSFFFSSYAVLRIVFFFFKLQPQCAVNSSTWRESQWFPTTWQPGVHYSTWRIFRNIFKVTKIESLRLHEKMGVINVWRGCNSGPYVKRGSVSWRKLNNGMPWTAAISPVKSTRIC